MQLLTPSSSYEENLTYFKGIANFILEVANK